MPPSDSKSITSTKSLFLTSQTRLLSAPLQLSAQYRSSLYSTTTTSPLSSKAVTDVISKTNENIRAHNRLVFSPQSTRHVAEQIETLYWQDAREDVKGSDGGDEGGEGGFVAVERDVDLSETADVLALPEELGEAMLDEQGQLGESDDGEKYRRLRDELVMLAKRRDEARERLERYKRLKELLLPYENAQENIQPNLVTKDGEMSKELDRMRVLLARVGARMGEFEGMQQQRDERRGKGFEERLGEVMDLG